MPLKFCISSVLSLRSSNSHRNSSIIPIIYKEQQNSSTYYTYHFQGATKYYLLYAMWLDGIETGSKYRAAYLGKCGSILYITRSLEWQPCPSIDIGDPVTQWIVYWLMKSGIDSFYPTVHVFSFNKKMVLFFPGNSSWFLTCF